MFTNVLVGVDGRTTGRDAIALARQLTDTGGQLTLANVYEGPLGLAKMYQSTYREKGERSRTLLQEELRRAGMTAELASISADTPGHGLHRQAEHQGADLLVVGSCSRALVGRAMVGDDTRAALNGAPCAIAIAPAGYAEHDTGIAKIGVAFNEIPESLAALAAARTLAAEHHATIHALEVVSLPSVAYAGYGVVGVGEVIEEMVDGARQRLSELPDVEGRVVHGLPGEELARFGDEVDLLVVGSRGYGPLHRLIAGSTSNYLERHARCPLLVLPRSATDSDLAQSARLATAASA
jgi:nucleotide-binding universal stress UspA family protein